VYARQGATTVVQHVAAVYDSGASILDLANGMGEDNFEDIISNSQIVDRPDDLERLLQRKSYVPKDTPDVELMNIISETPSTPISGSQ
jgi:hypothetical protein